MPWNEWSSDRQALNICPQLNATPMCWATVPSWMGQHHLALLTQLRHHQSTLTTAGRLDVRLYNRRLLTALNKGMWPKTTHTSRRPQLLSLTICHCNLHMAHALKSGSSDRQALNICPQLNATPMCWATVPSWMGQHHLALLTQLRHHQSTLTTAGRLDVRLYNRRLLTALNKGMWPKTTHTSRRPQLLSLTICHCNLHMAHALKWGSSDRQALNICPQLNATPMCWATVPSWMGQHHLALLTQLRHHQSTLTTAGRLDVRLYNRRLLTALNKGMWPKTTHTSRRPQLLSLTICHCNLQHGTCLEIRIKWQASFEYLPTAQRHPHVLGYSAVLNGATSSCTVDSVEAPPMRL